MRAEGPVWLSGNWLARMKKVRDWYLSCSALVTDRQSVAGERDNIELSWQGKGWCTVKSLYAAQHGNTTHSTLTITWYTVSGLSSLSSTLQIISWRKTGEKYQSDPTYGHVDYSLSEPECKIFQYSVTVTQSKQEHFLLLNQWLTQEKHGKQYNQTNI